MYCSDDVFLCVCSSAVWHLAGGRGPCSQCGPFSLLEAGGIGLIMCCLVYFVSDHQIYS